MPSLKELETELGLAAGTLTGKTDVAAKWDGYLTEGAIAKKDAEEKLAAAQKAVNDAAAAQRVIDEQIASFGLTESRVAQLEAANAALTAAQSGYQAAFGRLKEQGFTFEGITLPEAPTSRTAAAPDPIQALVDNTSRGFANMARAIDVSNRYQRVFGKPMPDNLKTLADEAAQQRLTVDAYAERKYGFAGEEKRLADEARAAHDAKIAADAVKKFREENPGYAGHPDLQGGVPSNYPAIPKPRGAASVREFASLPVREKIANALQRASQAAAKSA